MKIDAFFVGESHNYFTENFRVRICMHPEAVSFRQLDLSTALLNFHASFTALVAAVQWVL
jgi:hypothetical protein